MAEGREMFPILQNGSVQFANVNKSNLTKQQSAFPPNGRKYSKPHIGTSYGGFDVTPTLIVSKERNSRQSFASFISNPIVAVLAILVGLVLILTIIRTTTGFGRLANNVGSNLQAIDAPKGRSRRSLFSNHEYVDIEIPQGFLRGYKKLSRQNREYTAFYKVPYAQPPVGLLRFKDPLPPSNWDGLRDNRVVAPQCIQKGKSPTPVPVAVGEEDCLYANIYTPRLPQPADNSSKLFPVMVYIHGGGLTGNGSRYEPTYFMDEDVVLITFQFRLAAMAFLTTGDDVIRGNMANKDQIQLLKFVQETVKHFNGDKHRVTIFGNSYGGFMVGFLTISPMAHGLFSKAISQSGSLLCYNHLYGSLSGSGSATLKEVGRVLNCETEDSQQFLECMRVKDAKDIALVLTPKAQYSITIEDREGDESTKFLSEHPYKILESGRQNQVPYIIGNTNAEFYGNALVILKDKKLTEAANEHFANISTMLRIDLNEEEMETVREFYFGEERISNETFRNFGNLTSDPVMVHCSYISARMHAMQQPKTYLYWATKPPHLSYIDKIWKDFPAKELGIVHHADELQYLFPYYGYPEITVDDEEYFEYSKYLVKLWVHFARTGNGEMDGNGWIPVNPYGRGYANSTCWLDLNDNPRLTNELQQRMAFWDMFNHTQLRYD